MQEKASQIGRLSQFIDKFCFFAYNGSARMSRRGFTIYGRRFGTSRRGGDADVAESDAPHPLDSDMYRVYALHLHHKSTIAAPATDTAIVFYDYTNVLRSAAYR